jgi:hypothetical protein
VNNRGTEQQPNANCQPDTARPYIPTESPPQRRAVFVFAEPRRAGYTYEPLHPNERGAARC